MASTHFSCSIGPQPVAEAEAGFAPSAEHGADLRFHGVVRRTENGREIRGILYSHYETMALREMERIGARLLVQFPGHLASIYHRIGEVPAGEVSILIRVQTRHSAEGFALLQEYLRQVKTGVPIWKEPLFL